MISSHVNSLPRYFSIVVGRFFGGHPLPGRGQNFHGGDGGQLTIGGGRNRAVPPQRFYPVGRRRKASGDPPLRYSANFFLGTGLSTVCGGRRPFNPGKATNQIISELS